MNFGRLHFPSLRSGDRYKWLALALIWGGVLFQQGVRQIYGATLPSIAASLRVSSVEIGLVGTVFTFVYGAMMLCAGYLSDRFSRKWMLVLGVSLFAAGGFLSGFVSCLGGLVATYGVLCGLGQPLVFPPATALLVQLHGEETRATALSVMQSALYVGILVCAVGSGWLVSLDAGGWRVAFGIVGALALAWAVLMAVALRDTRAVAAAAGAVSLKEALRAVFAKRAAVLFGVYLIILNGVTIGFTIWTPSFIMDAFPSLSKGMAVLHAVLWMNAGAFAGVLFGGKVGDRYARIRPGVRMEVLAAGILGCGLSWFFVARASGLVGCCLALAVCGFFRGVLDSNFNVSLFDVIKPRYHASALGFMLGMSYVFGSLAPLFLGWMRERFSLRAGLMTFPLFYLAAFGLVLLSRYRYYLKERER